MLGDLALGKPGAETPTKVNGGGGLNTYPRPLLHRARRVGVRRRPGDALWGAERERRGTGRLPRSQRSPSEVRARRSRPVLYPMARVTGAALRARRTADAA